MKEEINVSDAEWNVLEILWSNPGSLIGEIRDSLSDSGWSYSTIKTLVLRLTQKGVLRYENSDKGRAYYPAVSEESLKSRETQHFIDRIYNGSVKMMFASLVKDSNLSKNDAEELMQLVDKMED